MYLGTSNRMTSLLALLRARRWKVGAHHRAAIERVLRNRQTAMLDRVEGWEEITVECKVRTFRRLVARWAGLDALVREADAHFDGGEFSGGWHGPHAYAEHVARALDRLSLPWGTAREFLYAASVAEAHGLNIHPDHTDSAAAMGWAEEALQASVSWNPAEE